MYVFPNKKQLQHIFITQWCVKYRKRQKTKRKRQKSWETAKVQDNEQVTNLDSHKKINETFSFDLPIFWYWAVDTPIKNYIIISRNTCAKHIKTLSTFVLSSVGQIDSSNLYSYTLYNCIYKIRFITYMLPLQFMNGMQSQNKWRFSVDVFICIHWKSRKNKQDVQVVSLWRQQAIDKRMTSSQKGEDSSVQRK